MLRVEKYPDGRERLGVRHVAKVWISLFQYRQVRCTYTVANPSLKINLYTPRNIFRSIPRVDPRKVHSCLRHVISYDRSCRSIKFHTRWSCCGSDPWYICYDRGVFIKSTEKSQTTDRLTPDWSRPCSAISIFQKVSPTYVLLRSWMVNDRLLGYTYLVPSLAHLQTYHDSVGSFKDGGSV